jgi:hypothetical protein
MRSFERTAARRRRVPDAARKLFARALERFEQAMGGL